MIFMWNKILELNWKTRFGNNNRDEATDAPITGTNGATPETMKGIDNLVQLFLSAVEVPVFAAAVRYFPETT